MELKPFQIPEIMRYLYIGGYKKSKMRMEDEKMNIDIFEEEFTENSKYKITDDFL